MGKIEQHADGLGTVTEAMVRQRARELAQIAGRLPDQVTEEDVEEARSELMGPPIEAIEDRGPQANAQILVEEGLREAEHERALNAAEEGLPEREAEEDANRIESREEP
ncbi:MAG: hypothetical protein JO317_08435 [Verrucomicrobiae bacterium]|nr:hypothetical protein [Verrucomicrobiae bacterium]